MEQGGVGVRRCSFSFFQMTIAMLTPQLPTPLQMAIDCPQRPEQRKPARFAVALLIGYCR